MVVSDGLSQTEITPFFFISQRQYRPGFYRSGRRWYKGNPFRSRQIQQLFLKRKKREMLLLAPVLILWIQISREFDCSQKIQHRGILSAGNCRSGIFWLRAGCWEKHKNWNVGDRGSWGRRHGKKEKIHKKNERDHYSWENKHLIRLSLLLLIAFLNRNEWTTDKAFSWILASARRRELHHVLQFLKHLLQFTVV